MNKSRLTKTAGVTRPREIIEEVTRLKVFETTTQIVKFLKEEYGLTASVEPQGEYVEVHLNDFRHDKDIEVDLPDDKIAKALLKLFNKIHKEDNGLKAINVWATEFGYLIVLDKEDPTTEEGIEQETKKLNENSLLYYYYYDAYDNAIDEDYIETAEDRAKNYNMRRTLKENRAEAEKELLNKLTKKEEEDLNKETEEEDLNKEVEKEVETDIDLDKPVDIPEVPEEGDTSNEALDNRFIWFFEITDEFGDVIIDEIDNLDEAIDLTELDGAAILVAYPYIDPDPEDDNVELQFADTPGPIIIWQEEEV